MIKFSNKKNGDKVTMWQCDTVYDWLNSMRGNLNAPMMMFSNEKIKIFD